MCGSYSGCVIPFCVVSSPFILQDVAAVITEIVIHICLAGASFMNRSYTCGNFPPIQMYKIWLLHCSYLLILATASEDGQAELTWLADVDVELQETLIVWSEGDNCDYALSFQEKKGCDEVWEKICQVVSAALY